ncbi:molecular chaperone [Vibrio sp. SS-MA-C1-2]|uniref:TorD/DmsD family molecular chaperone n=1 Tax=Vibrio sp. SS-MA-C1-2 TaxID=2908646 RepID=UPI001F2EAC62|nr:molecular chaperone [Vibrio sp. SS-MA-C1-2]UJF18419.1 molecular chaperone [Vibrio sp. SS-MA-C1-2]
MNNLALLPRALGVLYFYSPEHPTFKDVTSDLSFLSHRFAWQDSIMANTFVTQMQKSLDQLTRYEYSVLFEGQGEMLAPPWGSVYLNKDNIVMGDTTAEFIKFINKNRIEFNIHNQPLDHFALMLWTLAALCEEEIDDNQQAIIELLKEHLLPWGYRYLELLSNNPYSPFYAALAQYSQLCLNGLQQDFGISDTEIKVRLFK